MNVRFWSLTSLVAATTVCGVAATASAQQYIALPSGYTATDVTPDGNIVIGSNGLDSFIWKWRQDPLPTYILGGYAVGVSDDGSVIAGTIQDPGVNAEVAAIWKPATGWQSLGWLPNALSCPSRSNAYSISGDGTIVVGLSWNGCDGRGFRWTQATGMQELQPQGNPNFMGYQNRCSTISRDGSSMGGFAQGNLNRTPTYWTPNLQGSVLDLNFEGEVHGFNNNGSKSVGTNYFGNASGSFEAFIRDTATGTLTKLGTLNPGWGGNAVDISEDGNVIVGYDNLMLGTEAWVWTSGDGIVSLRNRLLAAGVAGVPSLGFCNAVSDDGSVIVGGSNFGPGFIAVLPILVNYGDPTPGCAGYPILSATPAPFVNTPSFTLRSTLAPPSSLGLVLITNSQDVIGSDPFGIGVQLHVDLFFATEVITLDAFSDPFGNGVASAAIANNPLLGGLTYYAQILWSWPFSTCFMPPYNLSTTQGLAITIQP